MNFTKKKTPVDEQIERLGAHMEFEDPASEQYKKMAETMETLYNAKNKNETCKKKVTPDVLIAGGFGIAQVLLILHHEYLHPITSKAFSMIWRNNPKI